jgi:glycosyltransferase involved in cell wall biosynthesis
VACVGASVQGAQSMNVISKVEAVPRVGAAAAGPYVGTQLPLISFIVVNYNYGRFLRQCVDSIFAQTYPVIECIVVDNKSTDESLQVIADLKATYPKLDVIYEPANLGQSAACVDGYNKSSGHFIVFVDADDYYFETFAETHFLVHLSLPQAVGFTSSDMAQLAENSIVLGTILEASGARDPGQFRVIALDPTRVPGEFYQSFGVGTALELDKLPIKFVPPRMIDWVWSPTSGTMYRRDAVALFADSTMLPSLRCSTDAFFNYAINAFSGSVLIGKSLAVYRNHGANQFARHASLNLMCNWRDATDEGCLAAKFVLMHMLANIDRFAESSLNLRQLYEVMKRLARKAGERRFRTPLARKIRALAIAAMQRYWRLRLGFK